MRVSKIELSQVGPFDRVEMTIPEPAGEGEIILFEGPNGSGKTTILHSLCALLECAFVNSLGKLNGLQVVARMQGQDALICAVFDGLSEINAMTRVDFKKGEIGQNIYKVGGSLFSRTARAFSDQKTAAVWGAFAYHGAHGSPQLRSDGPKDLGLNPFSAALSFSRGGGFSDHIGQILTNFESARTRAIVYAQERADPQERATMEARAKAQADSLRRMQEALSMVLGWTVRFEFSVDRQAPTVLFDGSPIPIDHLGEGLRRTFSWLIDLLARLELIAWEDASRSPLDQEFLLFLDEVDQSLHPTMQMRLMPALRKLFPRARIYASTHSPFVVASVEDGLVFSIQPDPKTHRVNGVIEPQRLTGGRTLEAVVEDVFEAPATFIDQKTRGELEAHKKAIDALRAGQPVDWPALLEHRRTLRELGEEVWTVVAMREVPVRKLIEEKVREAAHEGVSKATQTPLLVATRGSLVNEAAGLGEGVWAPPRGSPPQCQERSALELGSRRVEAGREVPSRGSPTGGAPVVCLLRWCAGRDVRGDPRSFRPRESVPQARRFLEQLVPCVLVLQFDLQTRAMVA